MSTTTPVSGVSGGSVCLADQVRRRFVRRWPSRPSPLSRGVPLADPLARQVSHEWSSRPSGAHSSDCEDVCLMRPFAPRGSQTGSPQVVIQAHNDTSLAGCLFSLIDLRSGAHSWLARAAEDTPGRARYCGAGRGSADQLASRVAEGQLSSRTLTVSTCCWNATALPPFMVHTWTIFTTAGSPELLCFHP